MVIALAENELEQARIDQLMAVLAFLRENAHLVEGKGSKPNDLFALNVDRVIIGVVELEPLLRSLL